MWDIAVIFGVEMVVLTLIYISFNFNKGIKKYLGVFIFLIALFLQQWIFSLAIDISEDAGKTAVTDSLNKIYETYMNLLFVIVVFFTLLIGLDVLEYFTGYNVEEEVKKRRKVKDEQPSLSED